MMKRMTMIAMTTRMMTSRVSSQMSKAVVRARLLSAVVVLAGCAPFTFAHTASAAAATVAAAQRTVQGRVVDKQDAAITGAVVYLKDTRSLSVKSYLTDEQGHFHFGQLADGADYEVWAEQNGKRSSSKSISQFNSKLDIQFILKIDTSK